MSKFKDLNLSNAFLFAATMSDEEICRKVLELILGIEIAQVHVHTENTLVFHPESHGIRLDVYAKRPERVWRMM